MGVKWGFKWGSDQAINLIFKLLKINLYGFDSLKR